jgi:hypothetical protein
MENYWTKWIEERISVRTFDNSDLKISDFNELNEYISMITNEVVTPIKFKLIHSQLESTQNIKLGTYGFINGTNNFIVGIIEKNKTNPVEFGYLMEKVVLFATGLGFGTCWLGGTFNRSQFESVLNLEEHESIGVLIAIGYKKDRQTLFEKAVRYAAKSNQRKPWEELFYLDNLETPLSRSTNDPYEKVLEMVRIAPSASNKQPWRIIKQDNNYHIYLCRTPGYGIMEFDLQMNDIGIAMCHFELSAREMGLDGKWIKLDQLNQYDSLEYITSWEIVNID